MANTNAALARATILRDRQRAKGLRPATIWIPDIRDPAYRARLDAACRELAALSPADVDADAAAGRHRFGWFALSVFASARIRPRHMR
ncbi:MAG TPA: antitoxin MazE-like protein [Acetobacteraceae bacterium]|nr:antitoxin MazE-like protein [Acetobacteraceae bacterium]